MPEAWFVRVQEREYGPADLETLLEWKAEGRLLPQNPVRRSDDDEWKPAGEVGELFAPPPPLPSDAELLYHRRTFNDIIAETFRIYWKGFRHFFLLALFVAIPSFGFTLAFSYVHLPPDGVLTGSTKIAAAIAIVMVAILLVTWPIFIGGLQFAARDVALNRPIRFAELLRRTIAIWPRIARLSLVVYGSYFFWTALPLLAILTLAASPSLISILVALVALGFQVYMAGRMFINFMFWQQSCTLSGLDGIEALQESKELARSRRSEPAMQRPLYRGAIIASLWLLLLLAFSVVVELPFTIMRFQGVTSYEQAYSLMQQLMSAPAPDAMTIVTDVLSSLMHAALRPLLGLVFIVAFFDAKATR